MSSSSACAPDGRRGLNILVVDDDPGCLGSLEDLLAHDGYRPWTASSGAQALEIARWLRTQNRSFELSILDVEVPDLSGPETWEELCLLWPSLRAIFISGNLRAEAELARRSRDGWVALPKPLDVKRVRREIARLVAAGGLGRTRSSRKG